MLSSSIIEKPRAQLDTGAVSERLPDIRNECEHYRALGIKLHLLADQCPTTATQQSLLEVEQEDCVKGQMAVLQKLSAHEIASFKEAKLMMSVWKEEVFQSQSEAELSETDRIALRLFDYIRNQSENG